jgi:hypothetical protein
MWRVSCDLLLTSTGADLTFMDYLELQRLLCHDFPVQFCEDVAKCLTTTGCPSNALPFENFFSMFQLLFYYSEFMMHAGECYRSVDTRVCPVPPPPIRALCRDLRRLPWTAPMTMVTDSARQRGGNPQLAMAHTNSQLGAVVTTGLPPCIHWSIFVRCAHMSLLRCHGKAEALLSSRSRVSMSCDSKKLDFPLS